MTSTLARTSVWPAPLLPLLERAAWLVLVGPLPHAQEEALLELATRGQRPVLLIDPRLEPESDRRLRLERAALPSLSLCSALLAAESGNQTWYRYNDPRWDGTAPPEQLLAQWPNLRLESLELLPAQRLDSVLSAWFAQAGTEPQEPGLLWLPGTQAAAVLAGAGASLERCESIWLEGAVEPDNLGAELISQLENSCHRLENDGAHHQLWQLDRHRLLERQMVELTQQREALEVRVEELQAQQAELIAERDQLCQMRDALQVQAHQQQERLDRINIELDEILALIDGGQSDAHCPSVVPEQNP